jgi:ADP-ribose pyrophosphatase
VKQYRHPVEHEVWEVPAGHIDPGENEDQAAARELKEETGLVAEKLICMGKYFTSPGFTDEAMTFFLALGLTRGPRIVVEGENDIVLDRFSFEAAWLLASKDLKTATGLLMAKDFLQAREDENAAEELGG